MDYSVLLRDFAERTKANLLFIESEQHRHPEAVYEVTQLVNSMLGLLVFPHELLERVPPRPLEQLHAEGWPVIETSPGFPEAKNLRELIRMLRNGIAHCNVEFLADGGVISGLRIWNTRGRQKNWDATLTITQLRELALRFVDLITEQRWSSDRLSR